MPTPLSFALTQRTNEPLDVVVAFPWRADQWPLPDGSLLRSDVRSARGDVDVLITLASGSGLTPVWDATNTQLLVAVYVPRQALAGLARATPYVGDVTLIRPVAGRDDPRVDVIGDFTLTVIEGVTHD